MGTNDLKSVTPNDVAEAYRLEQIAEKVTHFYLFNRFACAYSSKLKSLIQTSFSAIEDLKPLADVEQEDLKQTFTVSSIWRQNVTMVTHAAMASIREMNTIVLAAISSGRTLHTFT